MAGRRQARETAYLVRTFAECVGRARYLRAGRRDAHQDRKQVAAALRPIYTAPTVEAAETERLAFTDSDLGRKYPATELFLDQVGAGVLVRAIPASRTPR